MSVARLCEAVPGVKVCLNFKSPADCEDISETVDKNIKMKIKYLIRIDHSYP